MAVNRHQNGSGSYRTPVGEAARVVAAEGAVLEHAPALGAVTGGAGNMVDHAERRAGHDLGVVEVVDLALGEVLAPPLAMCPIGVAAVAGAHVQGHEAEGVDLEGHGLAAPFGEVDGGVFGVPRPRPVADVDLGPAQLLPTPVGPDTRGVVQDAEAVGLLLDD